MRMCDVCIAKGDYSGRRAATRKLQVHSTITIPDNRYTETVVQVEDICREHLEEALVALRAALGLGKGKVRF
jgi:hypothetical protein